MSSLEPQEEPLLDPFNENDGDDVDSDDARLQCTVALSKSIFGAGMMVIPCHDELMVMSLVSSMQTAFRLFQGLCPSWGLGVDVACSAVSASSLGLPFPGV
jgi:hypothetical protein